MDISQCTDTDRALQEWLKSSACFDILLKQIAPKIRLKAINQGIELASIGMDEDTNDLANCLWEFLYDKQTRFKDLNFIISNGNDSLLIPIVINRFFSYCLDERRSNSPFHAYYQHMRKVLSKTEGVQYLAEACGAYYAWSQNQTISALPIESFPEDSFCEWSQPNISAKDIHKKSYMIALSQFFWKEATMRLKCEHLIPIRKLTSYVASIYGLQKQTADQMFAVNGEDDNDFTTQIMDESSSFRPDKSVMEDQLEKRAKLLIGSWGPNERRLFLLRFEQNNTLEDTAKETGYKSASAVDYQLKKLVSAIRDSWEQWQFGYASYDDDLDTEQDFFFERLIYFCKSLK